MEPASTNSINETTAAEDIPPEFKLQWLNTTLNFIKNDSKFILRYPELSLDKIQFLEAMISGTNYDIGLGYRQLYVPLWEAMRILGLKYEFKTSVLHTSSNTGYLILEKISKTPREESNSSKMAQTIDKFVEMKDKKTVQETNITMENINKCTENTSKCTKVGPTIKKITEVIDNHKKLEQKANTVDNKIKECTENTSKCFSNLDSTESSLDSDVTKNNHIGKKYMKSIKKTVYSIAPSLIKILLQKILDFVSDVTQASLQLDDLAPIEVTFLQNFLGVLKRREQLEELFSPVCNSLLERINLILDDSRMFRLELTPVVLNKATCKRSLTFKKIPQFSKKGAKKEAVKKIDIKLTDSDTHSEAGTQKCQVNEPPVETGDTPILNQKLCNSSKPAQTIDKGVKMKEKKTEQETNNTMEKINKCAENTSKCTKVAPTINRFMEVIDKHKKLEQKANTVDNKIKECTENTSKCKPLAVNNTTDKLKKAIEKTGAAGLPNVKDKLIEGLNKPLESDIGIRMMKTMGWEGGALGMREGGITEPIMPALHLVKNAGLGHVKEKRKGSYHIEVLEAILDLLTRDISDSIKMMQCSMGKKGKQYINQLNRDLNTRTEPISKDKEAVALAAEILKILKGSPGVKFFITIVTHKQIFLEKLVEQVHPLPDALRESPVPADKQTKEQDSKTDAPLTKEQIKMKLHEYIYDTKSNDPNNNWNIQHSFLTKEELATMLADTKHLNSKALNHLKNRMFIMKMCLHFLKSDLLDVTIDAEIGVQSKNFVKQLCNFVNKRKPGLKTSIENMVWNHIEKNIGECHLIHRFGVLNFSFTKVYRIDDIDSLSGNPVSPEIINAKENSSGNTERRSNSLIFGEKSPKVIQVGNDNVFYFGKDSNGNAQKLKTGNIDLNMKGLSSPVENAHDFKSDIEKNTSNTEANDSNIKSINSVDNVASVKINDHTIDKTDNIDVDDTKTIRIMHIAQQMTAETAKAIQIRISNAMRNSKLEFVPALKCHGIANNSLIYSCYNSKAFSFLVQTLPDCGIIPLEMGDLYNMAVTLRIFDESYDVLFWLQFCNPRLDTEKWQVVERVYSGERLTLRVGVDAGSFHFICNSSFRLLAGIDEVSFDVL